MQNVITAWHHYDMLQNARGTFCCPTRYRDFWQDIYAVQHLPYCLKLESQLLGRLHWK